MDAEALKRWRGLHLRIACGETLSSAEEQSYRAGLRELKQGDPMGTASAARLQQLRQDVATLESERAELFERGRQLDLRIGTLEGGRSPSRTTPQASTGGARIEKAARRVNHEPPPP